MVILREQQGSPNPKQERREREKKEKKEREGVEGLNRIEHTYLRRLPHWVNHFLFHQSSPPPNSKQLIISQSLNTLLSPLLLSPPPFITNSTKKKQISKNSPQQTLPELSPSAPPSRSPCKTITADAQYMTPASRGACWRPIRIWSCRRGRCRRIALGVARVVAACGVWRPN